ncbi:MAG: S9 family peptidase [Chloroflexota bacterium]|nr:S9 family peptidase [Chloroflexota bacterium]
MTATPSARPLTPEVLALELVTAADPQVSPDGTRILYVVRAVDPDTHRVGGTMWRCDIDGANAMAVPGLQPGARAARWSPDGTRIAYVARAERGTALFVTSASGGEGASQELTAHAGEIGDIEWSVDGAGIAYVTEYDPENPDETPPEPGAAPKVRVTRRMDYKMDGRGWRGDVRDHIFVIAASGGERRRITTELVDHHAPQWSPDGKWIATTVGKVDGGRPNLVLINVASGQLKRCGPREDSVTVFAWSPSGDSIVHAGAVGHSFENDFYRYDVTTDRRERLTQDNESVPSDLTWLDETRVLVHAMWHGGSVLDVLDVRTRAVERIARFEARHAGMSVDREHRVAVQGRMSLDVYGEISVYDLETSSLRTITSFSDAVLAERPPARWQRFDVQRDLTIEAWLLLPPDFDPGKRYPVILDTHGGPTGNYGYGFMAHQQCFATNGFIVVFANPRGSDSYGPDFARSIMLDWGNEDFKDYMAVCDELASRPYVDPERMGIFGISYGGYMTSWAIGQTDRFKAAVCGEPMFDLESDWGTSDVSFNGLEIFGGGPPHARREWFDAHSPSSFAHRVKTPTLVFSGEDDQRCPIGQSEQMFIALRKAGVETEFARYPGGSHMFFAFGLPDHRADWLARTLRWFTDHLGAPVS